jgi:hypothetical protein
MLNPVVGLLTFNTGDKDGLIWWEYILKFSFSNGRWTLINGVKRLCDATHFSSEYENSGSFGNEIATANQKVEGN